MLDKCYYLSRAFLPSDTQNLFRSVMVENVQNAKLQGVFLDGIEGANNRSIEKTLETVFCSSVCAAEGHRILRDKDSKGL